MQLEMSLFQSLGEKEHQQQAINVYSKKKRCSASYMMKFNISGLGSAAYAVVMLITY